MCNNLHMATNLAIDDQLLEEARKIGGQKTKRATVTEALNEYIQRRKQQQIVELFGKVDWDAKTEVEIRCGPDRARDPVACAQRAHQVAIEWEEDERIIYRRYTFLMYAGIFFGGLAAILALRTWRAARRKG